MVRGEENGNGAKTWKGTPKKPYLSNPHRGRVQGEKRQGGCVLEFEQPVGPTTVCGGSFLQEAKREKGKLIGETPGAATCQ